KWGSQLVTTGNVAVDSAFVPGTAQWRSDSVYLGDFSASASGFIRVAFRNITNYENNLYIDDVQIYFREVNPNLRRKGVMATPNPFRNTVMVQHYPSPINLEYMEVYNSMGQRVWQRRFALGSTEPVLGPNSREIDRAGQPAGIYFLSITYRSAPRKIIKLVKTL
ncbi:MAG TPA: T9SS type A sorting domain-containing protein, partial [Lacibacter sp.]|nr:T9SS type A sorting domain-containing protein [Lacibacter sp.]